MRNHLFVGASLAAFTLLGFFFFPGHTFLQQDTQIYMPMLERLWDPTALSRDPLATRPHVSFTIYDEVCLLFRRLTGAQFETVLVAQQLLFRFLGLAGVYLIAAALRVPSRMCLLVAGAFSLGATILGPTVLTFEYEPVPRGFALLLLLLAVGLAAHGRDVLAGCAAALAFLYQAPSIAPFWGIYFLLTLWPSSPDVMKRRIQGLAPLFVAVLLMLVLSRTQPGVTEPQDFFSRITPQQEQVQHLRAPYNWVSVWIGAWAGHYLFLFAVAAAAFWRLRRDVPFDLKWFLIGLPLAGLASVPASYILLERLKWSLIPQFQPARAVLFITVMAVILGACAAAKAACARRWWESLAWLVVVFAVPIQPRLLELRDWPLPKVLTLITLAAAAALALIAESSRRRWAPAAWALAVLLPFWMIPSVAKTVNHPAAQNPELDQLSAWARSSTPKDSVFLFPDARRETYPGAFRARSIRAVYTDWKAGGQVNYHRGVAQEWIKRWGTMMLPKFNPASLKKYAAAGIDYLVVKPENRIGGLAPVFENASFLVYRPAP